MGDFLGIDSWCPGGRKKGERKKPDMQSVLRYFPDNSAFPRESPEFLDEQALLLPVPHSSTAVSDLFEAYRLQPVSSFEKTDDGQRHH